MKKYLVLLSVLALGTSCVDSDILPTDNMNSGSKVVGFSKSFETVPYFEDLGDKAHSFPVDLIGQGNGQLPTSDITVHYTVDPTSTATEGVEFDFVNSSRTVVIPAGGTFGSIPLTVHTGSLNPTHKTELILNLTTVDSNGVVIGSGYEKFSVIFVGCLSQLAGTYTVVVTRNDGVVRTYTGETVSLVDTNYFKTRTTGQWAAGTIAPDQGYNFTDICGDLTIAEQNLAQGYYSNVVKGLTDTGMDGHVTDDNHFTADYSISFAAGPRTYSAAYTRN